jgi:hypothetical protein
MTKRKLRKRRYLSSQQSWQGVFCLPAPRLVDTKQPKDMLKPWDGHPMPVFGWQYDENQSIRIGKIPRYFLFYSHIWNGYDIYIWEYSNIIAMYRIWLGIFPFINIPLWCLNLCCSPDKDRPLFVSGDLLMPWIGKRSISQPETSRK